MYVAWLGGQGGRLRDRNRGRDLALSSQDRDALKYNLVDLAEEYGEGSFHRTLTRIHDGVPGQNHGLRVVPDRLQV